MMDELKFRQKVYANPELIDPELLAMAAENPALQAIVDEARGIDARLAGDLAAIPVPANLAARLKEIPDQGGNPALESAANDGFFQYYALAACLVMAIGISLATNLRPEPSADNLQFGSVVLNHLYIETNEIAGIADGTTTEVIPQASANLVMANADSQLAQSQDLNRHPIYYAQPCPISPNEFDSAHLMVRGSKGTVNVIVTNNSPVETEFGIADERFQGLVIPAGSGNIVVIGEKDENLAELKGLLAATVGWSI